MKELYEKLQKSKFNVDANWFSLDRYDTHDTVKYPSITHEEVLKIIALVSKTRKGDEKALLVRMAYATAFRRDSLLELKWDNLIEIDGIKYVKTIGKGNKLSHKKISQDLYTALMNHKAKSDGDKIFKLTKKTVTKMMAYIRENIDFGDRHVVFHSFKKASIREVKDITGGDIKLMQKHGDHANASTTLNDYLDDTALEDLVEVDISTNIPTHKFETLSKEEMVELFKSMDRSTQIKLLIKMGEM